MTNFKDFNEVKIGDVGEEILFDILRDRDPNTIITTGVGKSPYSREGHLIDAKVVDQYGERLVEVKTKPVFSKDSTDIGGVPITGFDIADWNTYLDLHNAGNKVTIYFVDPALGIIYWANVDSLINPDGECWGKKLWKLTRFELFSKMTSEQIAKLMYVYNSNNKASMFPNSYRCRRCLDIFDGDVIKL